MTVPMQLVPPALDLRAPAVLVRHNVTVKVGEFPCRIPSNFIKIAQHSCAIMLLLLNCSSTHPIFNNSPLTSL